MKNIEEIISFLNNTGIKAELIDKDKYGFSRTISFKVYDIDYEIIWFVNESTLRIGNGNRASCIPFKYIYFDNTYPLVSGNRSIGFAYQKFEKKSIFDREFPFESFRIPIEIN